MKADRRTGFLFLILALCGPARAQDYYAGVDTSSAEALRDTLHELIDDHQFFPYTRDAGTDDIDTWVILLEADRHPTETGMILDLYKNSSIPVTDARSSRLHREHSWPKSYGFPRDVGRSYPFSDCHHLFLCNGSYNTSRSNKPYRKASASSGEKVTDLNTGRGGGSGEYPGNSSWTGGRRATGRWETWTGRRGDVARAQFYMDVRYEGGRHGVTGDMEPDLILVDDLTLLDADGKVFRRVARMGHLSTLIDWHLEDPVDELERHRNEVIFQHQGNRNPFIDHPQWVAVLYGLEQAAPAGVTIWINEIHYENASTDTGEFVEVAGPAGTDLTGWSLVAYNGNGFDPYKTVELTGIIPDQEAGMGALAFDFAGLQNGPPDGIALVDPNRQVAEFLAYEGIFRAAHGPADGLLATAITTHQSNSTPPGHSLQRTGSGRVAGDFDWDEPGPATRGTINTGQTF